MDSNLPEDIYQKSISILEKFQLVALSLHFLTTKSSPPFMCRLLNHFANKERFPIGVLRLHSALSCKFDMPNAAFEFFAFFENVEFVER